MYWSLINGPQKRKARNSGLLRGHERIRTAVRGFADLCLAARPRDHLSILECKYTTTFWFIKIFSIIYSN